MLETDPLDVPRWHQRERGEPDATSADFETSLWNPVWWGRARSRASPSPNPLLLALDGLTDPQNVGAVLRSAWFLGCDGILLSNQPATPVTPVVAKASVGALDGWAGAGRLFRVRKLSTVGRRLQQCGWTVLGGSDPAGGSRTVAADQADDLCRGPRVLVLGAEGTGLRPGVRDMCDALVHIPSIERSVSGVHIDSLNVSAAAAVLLEHLCRRQQRE